MNNMLLSCGMQFFVQLFLYIAIKTIWDIVSKNDYYDLLTYIYKNVKHIYIIKIFEIILIFMNIGISVFVKIFTSSGHIAGTSNMFASVLLGFVMAFDVFRLKRKLRKIK